MSWRSRALLRVSTAVAALGVLGHAPVAAEAMTAKADDALRRIGKNPADYTRERIELTPYTKYDPNAGRAYRASTYVYLPKVGAPTNYALWVSQVDAGRVEWWFDGQALTKRQEDVLAAACRIAKSRGASNCVPPKVAVRVIEDSDCYAVIYWTPPASRGSNTVSEDLVIVLDKNTLEATSDCQEMWGRYTRWGG
jgi:hypothetical protein